MHFTKRFLLSLALVVLGGALVAMPVWAQTELKMAYALSKDSHYGAGAKAFVESLAAADLDEELVIKEYPSSALGGEREVIEGLQLGTIDLAIVSTGATLNFVQVKWMLDFPFLFRDLEHVLM